MLTVAIVLFTFAVLIGVTLLTTFFLDGKTPRRIARTHGVIAVAALTLLVVSVAVSGAAAPVAGMVVMILAALGGATLFRMGQKNMAFPRWLPVLHGFVAAIGFLMLLIYL